MQIGFQGVRKISSSYCFWCSLLAVCFYCYSIMYLCYVWHSYPLVWGVSSLVFNLNGFATSMTLLIWYFWLQNIQIIQATDGKIIYISIEKSTKTRFKSLLVLCWGHFDTRTSHNQADHAQAAYTKEGHAHCPIRPRSSRPHPSKSEWP